MSDDDEKEDERRAINYEVCIANQDVMTLPIQLVSQHNWLFLFCWMWLRFNAKGIAGQFRNNFSAVCFVFDFMVFSTTLVLFSCALVHCIHSSRLLLDFTARSSLLTISHYFISCYSGSCPYSHESVTLLNNKICWYQFIFFCRWLKIKDWNRRDAKLIVILGWKWERNSGKLKSGGEVKSENTVRSWRSTPEKRLASESEWRRALHCNDAFSNRTGNKAMGHVELYEEVIRLAVLASNEFVPCRVSRVDCNSFCNKSSIRRVICWVWCFVVINRIPPVWYGFLVFWLWLLSHFSLAKRISCADFEMRQPYRPKDNIE